MAITAVTLAQFEAALAIVQALADTIKALGSVPSGVLYARVMGHMSLSDYEACIKLLVDSGKVTRSGHHLLTWVASDPVANPVTREP